MFEGNHSAEEDQLAENAVIPKFDMPCYESGMSPKDVKSLALRYGIPLDLHPCASSVGWTMIQLPEEVIECGDGAAIIKRRRQDLQPDGVRDPVTASGRGRLKEDLESSTWRRQNDNNTESYLYYTTTTRYTAYGIVKLPVKSSQPPHQVFGAAAWGIVSLSFFVICFVTYSRQPPWETRLLSVLLEITSNLTMKATRTPLSSPKGTLWCLFDPTPSGESLSEAWTRFKDLLQKVPHHGIDLWLKVQIFYDHVTPATRRTIDQSVGGKLHDRNAKESWALLEDLTLYDNESWNDPKDFAKPIKAISFPQDVPSTSDRRLIELENQVQRLMEAHLAPMQPTQVKKNYFFM
nr:MAK10-like protein [Tanacetum cinerariifolium]